MKETIKTKLKEVLITPENFSILINLIKKDDHIQNPYLNVIIVVFFEIMKK